MKDLASLSDFLVDVVCMMPPIDAAQIDSLPKEFPILACFGAVALLFFSILVKAVGEFFRGNKILAVIFSACITLLSFAFIARSEWEAIFSVAYPGMVIALRGAEGALIGSGISRKAWPWVIVIFVGAVVILYLALRPIPTEVLSLGKGLWAFGGALFASFRWSRIMSKGENAILGNPLSIFSVFIIFLSTILYISFSKTDLLFFQFTFPLELFLGILMTGKKDDESKVEEPNHRFNTDAENRAG